MPYTKLIAEKIGDQDDKAVWMLHEPLEWTNGIIKVVVPAGFQCDFASVPRLPIAYLVVGDTAHEAGTIHDYLYRSDAYAQELTLAKIDTLVWSKVYLDRKEADEVFLKVMGEMGINWFKRYAMYQAVRWGASAHWNKRRVADPFMEVYGL